MSKSIKDIATDAFMAGRKSMELEFESKGRAIQRPIDAQIKEYTKEIEAIIREAKPEKKDQQAQSTLEDESRCRFYRYGGYNFAIDEYEQTLIEALYGKALTSGEIADKLFVDEED